SRRDHVLADSELFRRHAGHRHRDPWTRAFDAGHYRRHDGSADLFGDFCRSGQHDADHVAGLYADCAAPRHRPDLVRRALSDLHAAWAAAAAARASADDDEGRCPTAGNHGSYIPRGCSVHCNEHRAAADHYRVSRYCDLVAESLGVKLLKSAEVPVAFMMSTI